MLGVFAMYKILRKFNRDIYGRELDSWPKPLQERVKAMVNRMKNYLVDEEPLTVKLVANDCLRIELCGKEGWFTIYEDGTGSFEPHRTEMGRYPTQHGWAFYTP